MRLTPLLLSSQYYINGVRPKNGRRPTRQPFPFNNCLPLSLRDHVSGKSQRSEKNSCIQEMTLLLACMKKNDFLESMCPKEAETLKKCFNTYMDEQRLTKEHEKHGILIPGAKKLSHKQMNQLLKQYPQPK